MVTRSTLWALICVWLISAWSLVALAVPSSTGGASSVASTGEASSVASTGEASSVASTGGASSVECLGVNLLAQRQPTTAEFVSGNKAVVTDGAVPAEGTDWETEAALILETETATLTYDLGEVRDVGAVYLQADANDVYTVWGSSTADPTGYRLMAKVPNVLSRGPGLRNRTAEFPLTGVRFLRVAVESGDGAYSVSEFSAYCRPPTPFPPQLNESVVANAPPGSPPAPAANAASTESDESGWLKVAAILGVVAILIEVSRRRDSGRAARRGSKEGSQLTAQASHRLLCGLFFASGCAALIYEIVWCHLLRLVIGASALSVAIVLASFMGGMFLGSLTFARFVRRGTNPVVVYAILEVGIGAFGLLMPVVLPAVKYVYVGLFGYGPTGIALRAAIAALLLLPPTALMGATLPAIARRYDAGRRGMAALTSLYAVNTLGAVAGCLLSAFYLLAEWDVWVATMFAVALNLAIGVIVFRWKSAFEAATPIPSAGGATGSPSGHRAARAVYLAAALSGLTALGAQVVWTRLLTLLFGASVYAFAIILAVFLAGLGLGSAWASRLLRRGTDAVRGLLCSQVALIPTMLLGGFLLAEALPYGSPPGWVPMSALHSLDIVRTVVVALPATVFWGASFPFALAAAGAEHDDTGRSTGRVYASNTVGAIIGSLAVSFWLIPSYGTHRASQALVFIATISAAALLTSSTQRPARQPQPVAKSKSKSSGKSKAAPEAASRPKGVAPATRYLLLGTLGLLGVGLYPAFPKEFLAHGRYLGWVDSRDQYPYVSEGAASTVAVHVAPDGYSNFHVSGRVEATNNPNDLRTERLIGHISAFSHPKPESVLVVGLGAGVTAGALTLHPEVKRIVICEIEPRVVGAAELFAKENYSALKNPKVELVFDDARHFLATTREKFDIITSDPIHPWVRGNSILFSREYYAIVKEHLKPGGLASQWVPLYETSELAIQIQAKTFMSAFADGVVWNTMTNNRGYDVVFVGATQPLQIDVQNVQARIEGSPALAASLREVRLGGAVGLLSTYGVRGSDLTAWLRDVPVNHDFSLKLEYISGLAMNSHRADEIYAHMIANRRFPESLFVGPPDVLTTLRRRIMPSSMR